MVLIVLFVFQRPFVFYVLFLFGFIGITSGLPIWVKCQLALNFALPSQAVASYELLPWTRYSGELAPFIFSFLCHSLAYVLCSQSPVHHVSLDWFIFVVVKLISPVLALSSINLSMRQCPFAPGCMGLEILPIAICKAWIHYRCLKGSFSTNRYLLWRF